MGRMDATDALGNRKPDWNRLALENAAIALGYMLLASLAFLLFRRLGVLPMPIWPSAALAIIVAVFRGWCVAPGLALGTVLANFCILGSTLPLALGIALMNTLGPLVGGWVVRRLVTTRLIIRGPVELLCCFAAIVLLPPVLTACGGIGCKWLLGMIPADQLAISWMKWAVAHALGSLLFAVPVFAWLSFKEEEQ